MITTPVYFPIVSAFGWDPVWFGAIMLLNLELATISPPFGLSLFVMKGITSKDTTMGHIYQAAIPFVALNLLVMAIMIMVPATVLWLPGLMR
ncbi:MAG: TRAP transporter large permease subunit, partial [Gammaproteobacteria bacterium]|jgi:TRAP-type mannitol/chloroaromatic compound transport system permease large subunit|nr:TRAP transporter large permease subunit [Gammaproteobacteria bacterium]